MLALYFQFVMGDQSSLDLMSFQPISHQSQELFHSIKRSELFAPLEF